MCYKQVAEQDFKGQVSIHARETMGQYINHQAAQWDKMEMELERFGIL